MTTTRPSRNTSRHHSQPTAFPAPGRGSGIAATIKRAGSIGSLAVMLGIAAATATTPTIGYAASSMVTDVTSAGSVSTTLDTASTDASSSARTSDAHVDSRETARLGVSALSECGFSHSC